MMKKILFVCLLIMTGVVLNSIDYTKVTKIKVTPTTYEGEGTSRTLKIGDSFDGGIIKSMRLICYYTLHEGGYQAIVLVYYIKNGKLYFESENFMLGHYEIEAE